MGLEPGPTDTEPVLPVQPTLQSQIPGPEVCSSLNEDITGAQNDSKHDAHTDNARQPEVEGHVTIPGPAIGQKSRPHDKTSPPIGRESTEGLPSMGTLRGKTEGPDNYPRTHRRLLNEVNS